VQVESFALRILPAALAWDGERLWIADRRSGRFLTLDPGSRELRDRFESRAPARAIAFARGAMWTLSDETGLARIDPVTGDALERIARAGVGLAEVHESLHILQHDFRRLERVPAAGGIALEELARLVAGSEGQLWGARIERPAEPPRFRWRGLAPGADPARPGEGARFEAVEFDPATGKVVRRLPLSQEPVALAWDGRSLWYAVRDAEGLERAEAP
jgi:hypothetical protein